MIISVPRSWNLSQRSLVSRLQEILAISSLGMMGVVGMRGSVHREEGLALPKSPGGVSKAGKSPSVWEQDDFSTNCSASGTERKGDDGVRSLLLVNNRVSTAEQKWKSKSACCEEEQRGEPDKH